MDDPALINELAASSDVADAAEGLIPEISAEDRGMLLGFWYPAVESRKVRGRDLTPVMLLGIPMVVGRDDKGRAFALGDNCPHRGMPLSAGRLDGGTVECCYHGWRFEAVTGQCREIPSLTSRDKLKVERIFALSFPCEEQDGYFWVYVPEKRGGFYPNLSAARGAPSAGGDRPADAVPPCPQLPVGSGGYRITHLSADLPCHVDHGIIGLMDPAHGPFVHQAWWWRSRSSIHEKEKVFEPIANGFRIQAHAPSKNSAFYKILGVYGDEISTKIEFVLPNMRFEEIRCGAKWFSSRTTVTPVTPERCRIDFCAAWNVFRSVPFTVQLFRVFGRMFIGQDQRTMEKQAEGLKHNPSLMLIDDADRPAKWYFQLKQAHVESRRKGRPFQHPIPGPVTLRWRS